MSACAKPDHWERLTDACVEGGFRDAHETEVVSLWAHGEIGRLHEIERVFNEGWLPPIPGERGALKLSAVKQLRALIRSAEERSA